MLTFYSLPEEVVFAVGALLVIRDPVPPLVQEQYSRKKSTIAFGEDEVCDACGIRNKRKQY